MILTPKDLASLVRKERLAMGLKQAELALTAGTGTRFISDLENGKPTCQIGKTLSQLKTLGIRLALAARSRGDGSYDPLAIYNERVGLLIEDDVAMVALV